MDSTSVRKREREKGPYGQPNSVRNKETSFFFWLFFSCSGTRFDPGFDVELMRPPSFRSLASQSVCSVSHHVVCLAASLLSACPRPMPRFPPPHSSSSARIDLPPLDPRRFPVCLCLASAAPVSLPMHPPCLPFRSQAS